MRPAIFALSVVSLSAILPVAQAAESTSESPDAASLFSQLDANKDGRLGGDEIPADRKSLFERLVRIGDKDGDGQLTAEEFAAGLAGGREQKSAASASRPERPEREGPGGAGRLFERLDANGDGKISSDEVPEQGRERFEQLVKRADKDGDGAVTRDEFMAAGPPQGARPQPNAPEARDPSRLFKRMDRNGDGKLTTEELTDERRGMFEVLIKRGDKDGDGALSGEEFSAALERARPDTAKARKPALPARPASLGNMPPGLFATLDADGDGELSASEIEGAAAAIRKLDADGDGTVSAREVLIEALRKRKQTE